MVKEIIVNLWMNGNGFIYSSWVLSKAKIFERGKPLESNWVSVILILSPVVLKNIIDSDNIQNFLSLHVAMTFLSVSKYQEYLDYAKSSLKYFVETFIILYRKQYVSHNIHYLLFVMMLQILEL